MVTAHRRVAAGAALVVAGVVLFAAGVALALALQGGDEEPAPAVTTAEEGLAKDEGGAGGSEVSVAPDAVGEGATSGGSPALPPGQAVPGRPPAPGGPGVSPTGGGAAAGRAIAYGGCPGTLGALVQDGAIALDTPAFGIRFPGDGFDLTSITVNAFAPCESSGETSQVITVSSSWRHGDSGALVWLTQQESPERTANVAYPGMLDFWSDGYRFSASVDVFPGIEEETKDVGGAQANADGDGLLELVLARLAPDLDRGCFYRQENGDWKDLEAAGIGDPRDVIPENYRMEYFDLTLFLAPPAACGEPPLEDAGTYFSAQFSSGSDAFLSLGASPADVSGLAFGGELHDRGASWTNGKLWFYVWSEGDVAIGKDVIAHIAAALDPEFDPSCLPQSRELAASEIADLGLPAPVPPEGFEVVEEELRVTELSGDCDRQGSDLPPSYDLSWRLVAADGTSIEASVNRVGQGATARPGGESWEYGLAWNDAEGSFYSVNVVPGKDGTRDLQSLVRGVAMSLDPGLDLEALFEGGAIESSPPVSPSR